MLKANKLVIETVYEHVARVDVLKIEFVNTQLSPMKREIIRADMGSNLRTSEALFRALIVDNNYVLTKCDDLIRADNEHRTIMAETYQAVWEGIVDAEYLQAIRELQS